MLFLNNKKEKFDAIEMGLMQNFDIEPKGILLIKKVNFTNEKKYYKRGTKILEEVLF